MNDGQNTNNQPETAQPAQQHQPSGQFPQQPAPPYAQPQAPQPVPTQPVASRKPSTVLVAAVAAVVALAVGFALGWGVRSSGANAALADRDAQIEKLNTTVESLQLQLGYGDDQEDGQSGNGSGSGDDAVQGKRGETVTSGGIDMKLIDAGEQATINYDTCGDGCSNGTYGPKSPDENAKYWVVTVEVTNNTMKPLDITCGYPYEIFALNSDSQQYTPIDGLYQVEGNPECNAQLQPGMTDTVTYPFMVPLDAKMVAIGFRDVGDLLSGGTGESEPSYIVTDDDYHIE